MESTLENNGVTSFTCARKDLQGTLNSVIDPLTKTLSIKTNLAENKIVVNIDGDDFPVSCNEGSGDDIVLYVSINGLKRFCKNNKDVSYQFFIHEDNVEINLNRLSHCKFHGFSYFDYYDCYTTKPSKISESASFKNNSLTSLETLQFVFKIVQDAFLHKTPWVEIPLKINELNDGTSFFRGLMQLGYFNMTEEEQMFFMIMTIEFILNEFEPVDFDEYKSDRYREMFITGRNRLLYKGLIERVHQSGATSTKEDRKELYLFAPPIYATLFKGIDDIFSYSDIAEQAQIIKQNNIVEKHLYFSRHDNENIQQIKNIIHPSRYNDIMEIIGKGKHKSAITCLLYGPSGTGKTELVKQIARETNRDILETSNAKLYSCFHGECEKNFTGLFRNYRYFCSITNEVPILLFNEADAFLMKRTTTMLQAIDKIENRIQNVLLQELEDFEGILFATTNMTCNIDPAFDRRFLFKIHLGKPDEEARQFIWKDAMPTLKEYETFHLASEYELTGAEIDNVARKIEIYEAVHGCPPLMSTIINFCESELNLHTSTPPNLLEG